MPCQGLSLVDTFWKLCVYWCLLILKHTLIEDDNGVKVNRLPAPVNVLSWVLPRHFLALLSCCDHTWVPRCLSSAWVRIVDDLHELLIIDECMDWLLNQIVVAQWSLHSWVFLCHRGLRTFKEWPVLGAIRMWWTNTLVMEVVSKWEGVIVSLWGDTDVVVAYKRVVVWHW